MVCHSEYEGDDTLLKKNASVIVVRSRASAAIKPSKYPNQGGGGGGGGGYGGGGASLRGSATASSFSGGVSRRCSVALTATLRHGRAFLDCVV